jgi:predicted nucleotidyltransferase
MPERAPLNRDEVLAVLGAERQRLKALGVRRIAVFGSIGRGEATALSDLDLLVELDRKSFDVYMDVKEFLEDRFGCPVDLVLADGIKPSLRPTILREAVHAPGL